MGPVITLARSYFGCSAICMLMLIMPVHRPKIR